MIFSYQDAVKLLRDTILRDGYKTGFPIIKELIQNANDAGSSDLFIGFSEALPNAKHPLLSNTPAMFVMNNGTFTAKDAVAISKLISDGKDDTPTIGKFGLGLKSLFHYCEAFFYVTSGVEETAFLDPFREHMREKYSKTMNIVTPWEDESTTDSPYQQWLDDISSCREHDYYQIFDRLKSYVVGNNWFILWVPLRTTSTTSALHTIKETYFDKGFSSLENQYINQNFASYIADILPMLDKLKRVHLVHSTSESTYLLVENSKQYRLSIPELHEIYQRGDVYDKFDKGIVSISTVSENITNSVILSQFVSQNQKVKDLFHELSASSHSRILPPHAGYEFTVNDDVSYSHEIKVFLSCFLPLSVYHAHTGLHSKFCLYMHGCFFTDSSRTKVYLESNGDEEQKNEVIWNREIVFDLLARLIPFVRDVSHAFNLSQEDIELVTVGIKMALTQHLSCIVDISTYINHKSFWIKRVCANSVLWEEINKTKYFRISEKILRHVDRFRGFKDVLIKNVFVTNPDICIINEEPVYWTKSILESFCNIDPDALINTQEFRDYWLNQIQSALDDVPEEEKHAYLKIVVSSLKQSVSKVSYKTLCENGQVIIGIISKITEQTNDVYVLSIPTKKLYEEVSEVVTTIIIPKQPNVDYLNNIKAQDAFQMLTKIKTHAITKEIHKLTAEVLSQTDYVNIDQAWKKMKVFRASKQVRENFVTNESKSSITKPKNRDEIESCDYSVSYDEIVNGFFVSDNSSNKDIEMILRAFPSTAISKITLKQKDTFDLSTILSSVAMLSEKSFVNQYYFFVKNNALSNYESRLALLNWLLLGYTYFKDIDGKEESIRHLITGKADVNQYQCLYLYKTNNHWYRLAKEIALNNYTSYDVVQLNQSDFSMTDHMQEDLNIFLIQDDLPVNLLTLMIPEAISEVLKSSNEYQSVYKKLDENKDLFRLPIYENYSGKRVKLHPAEGKDIYMVRGETKHNNIPLHNVILLKYHALLSEYCPPIHMLETESILALYLKDESPAEYTSEILNVLSTLADNDICQELLKMIKETKWIEVNCRAYSPSEILFHELYSEDFSEIICTYNDQNTSQCEFVSYSAISESIRRHTALSKLKSKILCTGGDAFARIGSLMGAIDDLCIVKSEKIPRTKDFYTSVFAGIECLPLNKYMRKWITNVSNNDIEESILPQIYSNNTTLKVQSTLLNELQNSLYKLNSDPLDPVTFYNDLVIQYLMYNTSTDLLNSICLQNAIKEWKLAKTLCFHHSEIPEEMRIAEYLNDALIKLSFIPRLVINNDSDGRTFEDEIDLLEYLREIGNHPDVEKDLVGVFLAFLGDGNPLWKELAENYFLNKDSVDSIRDLVIPTWDEVCIHEKQSLKRRFSEINVKLSLTTLPSSSHASTITGDFILSNTRVTMCCEDYQVNYPDYHFRIYKIDLSTAPEVNDKLLEICNFIIRKIFSITPKQSLFYERIWKVFEKSSQLNVKITQKIIQNELISIYKRFNIGSNHSEVSALLHDYDISNHEKAVAETNNTLDLYQFNEREIELKERAVSLIQERDVQSLLIRSIKREMSMYQYSHESTIYELFQNADDAYVEKESIDPIVTKAVFKVDFKGDSILIYHEGRNINEMRGSIAKNDTNCGFGNDLHKMLTLNYSDKRSNTLTGKFGLGFKSIFLLCEEPIVLSGKLVFRIQGGVYPVDIEYLQKQQYFGIHGVSHDYTLFDLNNISEEQIAVAKRAFSAHSLLLPVFAKRIRSLQIDENIFEPTISILDKSIWCFPNQDGFIVVFSGSNWNIAMRFTEEGFKELEDIKPIWVTVPTDTKTNYRIAINANFIIDIGRRQLALSGNHVVTEAIGTEFYNILMRRQLPETVCNGTGFTVSEYTFWRSLLYILSRTDVRENAMELSDIDKIFWQKDSAKYVDLLYSKQVLPNDLDGHMELTSISNLKYTLDLKINKLEFIDIAINQGISISSMVSSCVWERIPVRCRLDHIETIDEVNFLESLTESRQITPELSNAASLAYLKHTNAIIESTFRDYNKERLFFQSDSNEWKLISELIHQSYNGYPMLKQFITCDNLLSENYNTECTYLIELLGNPNYLLISDLIVDASEDRKIYALKYFIEYSAQHEDLFEENCWIMKITSDSKLYNDLEEHERVRFDDIMSKLFALDLNLEAHEKYTYGWFKVIAEASSAALADKEGSRHEERSIIRFTFGGIEAESRLLKLVNPSRYLLSLYEVTSPDNVYISYESKSNRLTQRIQGFEIRPNHIEILFEKPLSNIHINAMSKDTVFWVEFKGYNNVAVSIKEAYSSLSNWFVNADSLKDSLPEKIEFVFGPPGTGKTNELADRLIDIRSTAKNVLVLTPTNKSADELCTKIIEKDQSHHNWIVRFGNCLDSRIIDANWVRTSGNIKDESVVVTVTTSIRYPYDGYRNLKFSTQKWDYVIFDEASMIPVHYIVLIIQLSYFNNSNCQFMIAGDPFQIPPIYSFPRFVDKKGLNKKIEHIESTIEDENIYSVVSLDSFDPDIQVEHLEPHTFKVTNLNTQYRSLEPIGRLYSVYCYNDILKHHRTYTESNPTDIPVIKGIQSNLINVIKFPVVGGEIFRNREINKSHAHPYSAILIAEYLQNIDFVLRESGRRIDVGILCPYRPQVLLLSKLIAKYDLTQIDLQIDTVHGFQGGQKDVMFCIFNPKVVYDPGKPPRISCGDRSHINKKYILNVGISRARNAIFLLVPDSEYETDSGTKILNQYSNLVEIQSLIKILQHKYFRKYTSFSKASQIEKSLFNKQDYIYDRSLVIEHDLVNVYKKAPKKFLVSHDLHSMDVQLTDSESIDDQNLRILENLI